METTAKKKILQKVLTLRGVSCDNNKKFPTNMFKFLLH